MTDCPSTTGVDAVVKVLSIDRSGVGEPLFVITQFTSSAAWIVKFTGIVVRVETLVPVALLLVQVTTWA